MSLPPEIVSEILWRVPVKSLLRFRCTSKPFCSLIDDPEFTNFHLNSSSQSLVFTSGQLIYTVDDLPSLERAAVEVEHPLKTGQDGYTKVVGSCNGLMCLSNSEDTENVVLWNMSTGKHFPLPRIHTDNSPVCNLPAYGFGYDSVHHDYKLVRIDRCLNLRDTQVMIFRLNQNSWEMVADFPYRLSGFPIQTGVFADGALHWLIDSPYGGEFSMIAAFDLATEEYREVPPPQYNPNGLVFTYISALGSRLCVTCNYVAKPTELWVLRSSWAKLLSISDPELKIPRPIAYLSNGNNEVLLLRANYNRFLLYDLRTNQRKDVTIQGLPPNAFNAMLYVDSLVNPLPMVNVTNRDGFLSKVFKLVYGKLWKRN